MTDSSSIPTDISKLLDNKLSGEESQRVKDYIQSLQAQIVDLGGNLPAAAAADSSQDEKETSTDKAEEKVDDSGIPLPVYDASSGNEDYEKAGEYKIQASDEKSAGNYEKALGLYNQAVVAAPPSALLYSNRAICLMKLGHNQQAEEDCNRALELNPDSAKALKTRGKVRYSHLDNWKGALSDLSQAQSIDFDPELVDTLKELTKLRVDEEKEQAKERLAKEEKLRKKAAEIRKNREEAAREQQEEAKARQGGMPGGMGGMPGGMGGMPGGMGGMPGMGGMGGMPGMGGMDMGSMMGMMSDPEIQEAMKNPKVVAAFSELMGSPGGLNDPSKLTKLMSDPEVGPILQKIMSKMGGGGGAGMGGMPGMGGFGGGHDSDDDGVPDLDDLGDLPDLD